MNGKIMILNFFFCASERNGLKKFNTTVMFPNLSLEPLNRKIMTKKMQCSNPIVEGLALSLTF